MTPDVIVEPRPRRDADKAEDRTPETAREVLSIGIDLGTSRAAIVASNGARRVVESIVGWPRDPIAARRHGKALLFGREALENRLSLHLYRPLERGVLKTGAASNGAIAEEFRPDPEGNRKAAQELVRHLVSLADPRRGQALHGVLGVPAQASVESRRALLEIAGSCLDRVLIVSQPFAVAYGIGALDGALVVDIGAGTTDLCRMHGSLPTADDQITFPVAGDAVDEAILRKIRERHPRAQVTITMAKEIKERGSTLVEGAERIVARVPVDGVPTDLDVTEEVKGACALLVDPIVEAARKLISTHHPEFQDRLRGNVVLSGGGCLLPGLAARIEARLASFGGGRVTCVPDPLYAGADGAARLAVDMPAEYWDRI